MPIMCTCLERLSHSPSPDGSSFVPRRPKSRLQWVSAQRSLLATTTPLAASRACCIGPRSAPHPLEQLHDLEDGGSDRHREERGQDEERERDQQLDRQLAGGLLGALPPLGAQQVG